MSQYELLIRSPVIPVLLAFLLYANTIGHGFSVDDEWVLDGNELVQQGISAIPEILTTNYIDNGQEQFSYRPITMISFALTCTLFGAEPLPAHCINVLLFAITIGLLYYLLLNIFGLESQWIAWLSCLLFAAHPIHTEVVASLKSRDELLAFLFAISSALLFFRFVRSRSHLAFFGGTVFFLCALGSKESAQPFLLSIPLMLWFGGVRNRKELLAVLTALLIVSALFWFFVFSVLPTYFREFFVYIENPLAHTSDFNLRYGTAFYGLMYYLKLLFWPHPLGFFYGYDQVPLMGFGSIWVWLSLAVHLLMLWFAYKLRHSKPVISFALSFYLISIAMFSNLLFPVSGIIAERFIYSASLGFCLAISYGIFHLLSGSRTAAVRVGSISIIIILVSAMSYKTMARNTVWKDRLSLAAHDSKSHPNSAIVQFYYGLRLSEAAPNQRNPLRNETYRSALEQFNKVIAIHPESAAAYRRAAEIYTRELKQLESAADLYDRLLKLKPGSTQDRYNYALCLQKMGALHEAIQQYTFVMQSDERHLKSCINIGHIWLSMGDTSQAIQYFGRALQIDPQYAELRAFYEELISSKR